MTMDTMRTVPRATETSTRDRTIAVLTDLLGETHCWDVRIRLWDGTTLGPTHARTTIVLPFPWSLRSLMWPPNELNAGEAFIFGDIDIEGDIEGVFDVWDRLSGIPWKRPRFLARLGASLLMLPARPSGHDASRGADAGGALHSRERDRAAVRYHYDVSNTFFARWLDSRMQYSCGYFRSADDDLEAAQLAKVEHICRKLRLREGDRLLDIGCGWGGLLEHAATRYGVQGLGITLSEPQADHANER
ncbi:MAG TPA: class I SAM-dependent methyltransferase, partial [Coriobacteriia bacterium]